MKQIFIACDTQNSNHVQKIIKETNTKKLKIGYKLGLEFFTSKNGRLFISKIKNKVIFLDLKLNDIPNTCASTIYSLKDLKNVNYITVHANSGKETLKAVIKMAKETNPKLKILAVTVLTSISNSSIKKIGHTRPIKELVKKQALLAKSCGCHGIVCSAHEAKFLKKVCKRMEIITPGIRFLGDSKGDQQRVKTPKEAFQNGATSIVIGRSITKGNIKNNIQKLIKSLN